MTTVSIINGQVIDATQQLDQITALHIAEGKIVAIGDAPEGFTAETTIDAHQQVVCAGLVDLSARLREPGLEYKATIASETRAAAQSGITSLCCPPDTDPVIDTPAVAELLATRSRAVGMSKVYPLAALTKGLTGQELAEMGDLKEAGCLGVSNGQNPIENTDILRHCLEYASSCDLTVFIQARDAWLGRHGTAHEGAICTRMGLTGIPEASETMEVARVLLLVEFTGARVHFCRLSTARAMDMIKEAQKKGLPVTADVAIHQLYLTDMDISSFDGTYHVFPPLRSERDKNALRMGLVHGGVDAICSDHQPHEIDAKLSPFAMTDAGMSGLDTLLPLALRLVDEKICDLSTALQLVTSKPADILGIDAGTLKVGCTADICIFDAENYWTLEKQNIASQGKNSAFINWEFKGKVMHTLINGQVVYSHA